MAVSEFSSKAIHNAFFSEIFSSNLSKLTFLHSNELEIEKNNKRAEKYNKKRKFKENTTTGVSHETNPKTSFSSPGEYIDYWADILFHDIKAKIISSAKENIRKNLFCNYFECTKPDFDSYDYKYFKIFIDQEIAMKLDLRTNTWFLITTKVAMDKHIALINQKNKSINKNNGLPKGFICVVLNSSPLAFANQSFGRQMHKKHFNVPPVELSVKGKISQKLFSRMEKLFVSNVNQPRNSVQNNPNSIMLKYKELVLIPLENLQNKLRQFEAIVNVKNIPLYKEILSPNLHDSTPNDQIWKTSPERLKIKFKNELNRPQYDAIKSALKQRGITILQGPPGTGKTRTVIALLNLLHINAYNKYYNSLIEWIKDIYIESKKEMPNIKKVDLKNINLTNLADEARSSANLKESDIRKKRPRILVCTPSNAAVDEILSRLATVHLYDNEERLYTPRMVRIGKSNKMKENVQFHLSLTQITDAFFRYNKKQLNERINLYKNKLLHVDQAIMERRRRFVQFYPSLELIKNEEEARLFLNLYEDRHQIRLETLRLCWVKNLSEKDARKKLERSFVEEAEIVFSTLNGCGGKEFKNLSRGFDFCIVDEAAQCIEPDTLIPLHLGIKSVFLVGDHQQLPPTVFASGPKSRLIEQSLFERFHIAGFHTKNILRVQYRMHPEISKFPSKQFYQSKLIDGGNVAGSSYAKPFHNNFHFGPYRFYDLQSGESRAGFSLYNNEEADFVVKLLESLGKEFGPRVLRNVGIITFYKEQTGCIKKKVAASSILKNLLLSKEIEIATVDFFQGREKDIIILSCVRASGAGSGVSETSIGFVADIRRLNVSITRAKFALWVVGSAKSLSRNAVWNELVKDACERNCFIKAEKEMKLHREENYYSNKVVTIA